jgi:hypothetical protein
MPTAKHQRQGAELVARQLSPAHDVFLLRAQIFRRYDTPVSCVAGAATRERMWQSMLKALLSHSSGKQQTWRKMIFNRVYPLSANIGLARAQRIGDRVEPDSRHCDELEHV